MQPVPFYGKIAAGEPLLIPENRERFITLDRAFVPSEDCFFLRVVGDSMIGRGIFDRDFVLVDPSARASDGDIIAARVGEEATVKTLQHRGATNRARAREPGRARDHHLAYGRLRGDRHHRCCLPAVSRPAR
jgi:repressor LexA